MSKEQGTIIDGCSKVPEWKAMDTKSKYLQQCNDEAHDIIVGIADDENIILNPIRRERIQKYLEIRQKVEELCQ